MYYIGVDLGGTNIAVGLVDEQGKITCTRSQKTRSERGWVEVIKTMAECIKDVIKASGVSEDEIASIGVGSPGALDPENGVIIFAGNLGFDHVPLREELNKYFDKKVFLGNDANCAALGEQKAGAAKGCNNAVMITLGTGVGGGIIINGKIYEGQYAAGAELGHICIVKDGEPCTCGRLGCWEAYASATALIRQTAAAAEANPDSLLAKNIKAQNKVTGRTAFAAAENGCPVAKEVCRMYIEYIAEGLLDITAVFRPEVIIIGGGICNEGDALIKPLCEYVHKHQFGGDRLPHQKIEVATLGNDSGIIGAAMLGA